MRTFFAVCAAMAFFVADDGVAADLWSEVEHHYVESNGVRIHYVATGEGPLVVMIHGFPDFWYTWRHQMAGLSDKFRVVAIDQRGYNLAASRKASKITT